MEEQVPNHRKRKRLRFSSDSTNEQDEDVCFSCCGAPWVKPAGSCLLICCTDTDPCGKTNMADYARDYSAIFRRQGHRLIPALLRFGFHWSGDEGNI